MIAILSKRNFDLSIVLWILWNLSERLFYGTPVTDIYLFIQIQEWRCEVNVSERSLVFTAAFKIVFCTMVLQYFEICSYSKVITYYPLTLATIFLNFVKSTWLLWYTLFMTTLSSLFSYLNFRAVHSSAGWMLLIKEIDYNLLPSWLFLLLFYSEEATGEVF